MSNPPRIWLDYRPVRIGWVVCERDITLLTQIASWNTCIWGGRFNCVVPAYDTELADRLVSCFAVDILLPVRPDKETKTFIDRFPHLAIHRWSDSIFAQGDCEFADIRHALRRIAARPDKSLEERIHFPTWDANDPLGALFAAQFGSYPAPDRNIADYKAGVLSVA